MCYSECGCDLADPELDSEALGPRWWPLPEPAGPSPWLGASRWLLQMCGSCQIAS